jgi:hypothetical protein
MINKDNIEVLYPGIVVFRNGLQNAVDIIKAIDASSAWEPWYNVGEQIILNNALNMMFDNFPTEEDWGLKYREFSKDENPVDLVSITSSIEQAFYEATSCYFDMYKPDISNWMHGASNILKYHGRPATESELEGKSMVTTGAHDTNKGEAGGTKDHTLPFHTDFYQANEFVPGPQAEYTITIYLNDDYVGGEIDYRIFDGRFEDMKMENEEIVPLDHNYGDIPKIMYRPQAGDIIIFPSRPPYYHGVRRVEAGIKKFIRMFWMSYLYPKDIQEEK